VTLFKSPYNDRGHSNRHWVAGTGIGAYVGTRGFFRHLMPLRDLENCSPLELGIGLGIAIGLVWGLIVGVWVVAILALKETRMPR